jgi:hypothetical protein
MMNEIEKLRHISPKDFALHGVQDIAYVKRVIVNDAVGFAIHAADGSPLAVMTDRDIAFAAIRQNGLEPLSLH